MRKIKEQVGDYIQAIGTKVSGIVNVDRRQNAGQFLFDLFVWQEVSALAEGKLKKAWSAAQDSGIVSQDASLRELATGEHIVAESAQFSCLVKVQAPRNLFDKELFLEKASKALKVPRATLVALMEEATAPGKAPLCKRVIEV